MRTFKFTFETTIGGKTKGITVEAVDFHLAVDEACERLKCGPQNLEHIKSQRLEGDIWITLFDPFRGVV